MLRPRTTEAMTTEVAVIDASVPTTRTERGIRLWQTSRQGIERRTRHEWAVPSCSGGGDYLVNTKTGVCDCPDSPRAREQGESCKHLVAAMLTAAHRAELRTLCRQERSKSR